jgi:opacity protein-like surface antigen
MKAGLIAAAVAAAGLVLSAPAIAQQRTDTRTTATSTGTAYPWEQRFWGYTGLSVGGGNYDLACIPGLACDEDTGVFKLFAGGRFNDMFGLEASYVNLGKAQFAGGDLEAHGLNFSLVAGVPLSTNTSVFGKIGTTYGRTKLSGTVPAVQTGTEDDWGLSYGIGAQLGLNDRWAVRVDADRYRFQFVNSARRSVDTLTVGLQYRFQ